MPLQLVLDTNVIFSALHSRRGASFTILNMVSAGRIGIHLSVPLLLQYEDVLKRSSEMLGRSAADIDVVIDRLCSVAAYHEIYYLWRPFLPDVKDDLVLELAVTARCTQIVTYNLRDFRGADSFGIKVVSPIQFLRAFGDEI